VILRNSSLKNHRLLLIFTSYTIKSCLVETRFLNVGKKVITVSYGFIIGVLNK